MKLSTMCALAVSMLFANASHGNAASSDLRYTNPSFWDSNLLYLCEISEVTTRSGSVELVRERNFMRPTDSCTVRATVIGDYGVHGQKKFAFRADRRYEVEGDRATLKKGVKLLICTGSKKDIRTVTVLDPDRYKAMKDSFGAIKAMRSSKDWPKDLAKWVNSSQTLASLYAMNRLRLELDSGEIIADSKLAGLLKKLRDNEKADSFARVRASKLIARIKNCAFSVHSPPERTTSDNDYRFMMKMLKNPAKLDSVALNEIFDRLPIDHKKRDQASNVVMGIAQNAALGDEKQQEAIKRLWSSDYFDYADLESPRSEKILALYRSILSKGTDSCRAAAALGLSGICGGVKDPKARKAMALALVKDCNEALRLVKSSRDKEDIKMTIRWVSKKHLK